MYIHICIHLCICTYIVCVYSHVYIIIVDCLLKMKHKPSSGHWWTVTRDPLGLCWGPAMWAKQRFGCSLLYLSSASRENTGRSTALELRSSPWPLPLRKCQTAWPVWTASICDSFAIPWWKPRAVPLPSVLFTGTLRGSFGRCFIPGKCQSSCKSICMHSFVRQREKFATQCVPPFFLAARKCKPKLEIPLEQSVVRIAGL